MKKNFINRTFIVDNEIKILKLKYYANKEEDGAYSVKVNVLQNDFGASTHLYFLWSQYIKLSSLSKTDFIEYVSNKDQRKILNIMRNGTLFRNEFGIYFLK